MGELLPVYVYLASYRYARVRRRGGSFARRRRRVVDGHLWSHPRDLRSPQRGTTRGNLSMACVVSLLSRERTSHYEEFFLVVCGREVWLPQYSLSLTRTVSLCLSLALILPRQLCVILFSPTTSPSAIQWRRWRSSRSARM